MIEKITVRNVHERFRLLYNKPDDINLCICIGGRGGRKTYEISKLAAQQATTRSKRIAIMRDEKETIKESILNEVFQRFDSANKYGHFNGLFEKQESGIKDVKNDRMCVFTKGFRASSLEKRTNLKGVSDCDIAIVEEAEDIRSFEKFNTMKDSIRTQGRLIIVILNTPDIQHWIVQRHFNLELVNKIRLTNGDEIEVDGYWRLIPKDIPGFYCIQTSYLDNEFLPSDVVRDYMGYGDPNSYNFDLHYYLTSILGLASSGRKGQVLRKVKPIKYADYNALLLRELTGLDFGTSSPAGIVGVKMEGDNLYALARNYKPMDTLSLARWFRDKQYKESDLIIADSADPISIGKLRRGYPVSELAVGEAAIAGLNIRGAIKGPGSVEAGLGMMNGMNIYFVDDVPIDPILGVSPLWHEVYNYIYAQSKSGEYTNDPIDEFNHLIDPTRYVAQSRGRFF